MGGGPQELVARTGYVEMYQCLTPFHSWIICHCVDIPHFGHQSQLAGTWLLPLCGYYRQ